MPVKAWIGLTRVVVRKDAVREEVSHTRSEPIVPVTDMLDAGARFHAQPLVYLPRIVHIEGGVLVSHVADRSAIALRVAGHVSYDEVRRGVVWSTGIDTREDVRRFPSEAIDASIRVRAVIALLITGVLGIGTKLYGVRTDHFSKVIREAWDLFTDEIVAVWLKIVALREIREGFVTRRTVRRN